jgi:hypothetical protein
MRAGLAAKTADRLFGVVVLMAGVLAGILVFVVALPLAFSNPFPTPRQGDWIIQASLTQTSAAASPLPIALSAPETIVAKSEPTLEQAMFGTRWNLTGDRPIDTTADDAPTGSFRLASADESIPMPVAPSLPQIAVPAEATRIKPTERKSEAKSDTKSESKNQTAKVETAPAPKREINPMDEVDRYLWDVYEREPIKKDSSGDFTWKDPAAAKKLGMTVQTYAIGGMDRDFREQLYHAGHAMDAVGLHWSMLSAFRDDYRQALASGFKARPGNSLHGGSRATGGYGYGRAIDITATDGDAEAVWHWVDAHGAKYGLRRPMPGYDPAHIQSGGAWHEIAQSLRSGRTQVAEIAHKPTVTRMAFRSRSARM